MSSITRWSDLFDSRPHLTADRSHIAIDKRTAKLALKIIHCLVLAHNEERITLHELTTLVVST